MPMTCLEVGTKLVELCSQGKNHEAMETLYHPDVVSVEAGAPPGQSPESKGLAAVKAKSQWWADNHIVHSAEALGPWPHGDRFAVKFKYDITNKPQNKRVSMEEIALFTVKDGKIIKEEFFYTMG